MLTNLGKHFLSWFSSFNLCYYFLLQWKKWKWFISTWLFFTPCLDFHCTVFAAALQSQYILRGNIFSGCLFPFPAWFAFNCFIVVRRLLPAKRFIPLTGNPRPTCPTYLRQRICLKYSHCHHWNHLYNAPINSKLQHPPRAYPGHLTLHRARGGGTLNLALEGWGIWTGFISCSDVLRLWVFPVFAGFDGFTR